MNIKHTRSGLFAVPFIMAVAFIHVPTPAQANDCNCSRSGSATQTCTNGQFSSTVDVSLYWFGSNGYYFGTLASITQVVPGLGTWNTACDATFYAFWPWDSKRISVNDAAAGENEDWEISTGWLEANDGDMFYGSVSCEITAGFGCGGSSTSHAACKLMKSGDGCFDAT